MSIINMLVAARAALADRRERRPACTRNWPRSTITRWRISACTARSSPEWSRGCTRASSSTRPRLPFRLLPGGSMPVCRPRSTGCAASDSSRLMRATAALARGGARPHAALRHSIGDRIMRLGIHLPHIGRKAGPDAIRRAAIQAEELGFADVWVSEHIIVPKDAAYPPSAIFWDPVLTLTWAAACTSRVGLGTSVLVLPMRHPLPLAKELATLQNLSGRPADPRRRRRLAGSRIRGARRAVPRARPAHGRRHRDDARGVERRSRVVPGARRSRPSSTTCACCRNRRSRSRSGSAAPRSRR